MDSFTVQSEPHHTGFLVLDKYLAIRTGKLCVLLQHSDERELVGETGRVCDGRHREPAFSGEAGTQVNLACLIVIRRTTWENRVVCQRICNLQPTEQCQGMSTAHAAGSRTVQPSSHSQRDLDGVLKRGVHVELIGLRNVGTRNSVCSLRCSSSIDS